MIDEGSICVHSRRRERGWMTRKAPARRTAEVLTPGWLTQPDFDSPVFLAAFLCFVGSDWQLLPESINK
jgi:hypothetical protein